METHIEKRKLAAVMFADIEGYTALFQKNESSAFEILEQHRKDLKETTEKHKGHIVKYYGDGSLTIFTSVIEAALCAIDLQLVSAEHKISLRIGLHMGEMIEKDKDVYGDAVNVASRIQALGSSGSILVSKIVEDELKNHPNITTKSLGLVKLKNVKKAIEVFALTTTGLTHPHSLPGTSERRIKKYASLVFALILVTAGSLFVINKIKSRYTRFGDECVIIPPFSSHGPIAGLEFFSTKASSELIKAMSESAKANIIPYNTMLLYSNADISSFIDNPSLAKRLGAQFEVKGDYTLEGKNLDTLHISLSILDLKKNRLLQTPIQDVKCASSDNRKCLEEAKNILVGYWKSKKDQLLHFTTDSAYINFSIAQKKWADPNNKEDIKSHLIKAIHYDPKFLDAWFLLLDLYHNDEAYQDGINTIEQIEELIPDLDQNEAGYLGRYKADFQGNNIQAFRSFLKEYQQNPKDLFINNTGMVMALEYLNDPLVTLQMFNKMAPDSLDLSTCVYCFTRFSLALHAYVGLFDLKKAGILAEQIKPYATKTSHFISLLNYYTQVKDTVTINDVIRRATRLNITSDEEPYLYLITARLAAVKGDFAIRDQYANKAIRFGKNQSPTILARSYLLLNKLDDAKSIYLEKLKQPIISPSTLAYLGIIYAREGDLDSANKMIEKIGEMKEEFDMGYAPYYQGRIKANLGEFNAALTYFKNALEEGIRFLPSFSFLQDPDMIIMNSNKEYLSLLGKNRLNKIE